MAIRTSSYSPKRLEIYTAQWRVVEDRTLRGACAAGTTNDCNVTAIRSRSMFCLRTRDCVNTRNTPGQLVPPPPPPPPPPVSGCQVGTLSPFERTKKTWLT